MNKRKIIKTIVKTLGIFFLSLLTLYILKNYFNIYLGDIFVSRYLRDIEIIDEIGMTKGILLWSKLQHDILNLVVLIIVVSSVFAIYLYYYIENKVRKNTEKEIVNILQEYLIKQNLKSEKMEFSRLDKFISQNSERYEIVNKYHNKFMIKEEMISNFSHDIKTPLTSVIGYLNLIVTDKDISDKSRNKYTKIALQKSIDMEKQLDDLFYISMFDFEHKGKSKKVVNLYNFIKQIIDEFYPNFVDKNMNVEYQVNKEIEILANLDELSKALGNIINNAIKYGNKNSILSINVHQELEIVRMEISNKTECICEQDLSRIFDRFYRRDISRNSSVGGAGLGLAIAKAIIVDMEGEIYAKYNEGLFTVVINLKNIIYKKNNKIK